MIASEKFRDLQVHKDYKTLSSSRQITPPPPTPYIIQMYTCLAIVKCKDSDVFLKDILERLGHAHPGAD